MSHDLGGRLQSFFETYLREQRALSPNTVKSYRDTFKLLIAYLDLVRRGERLRVQDLDAKTVLAFLRTDFRPSATRTLVSTFSKAFRTAALPFLVSFLVSLPIA